VAGNTTDGLQLFGPNAVAKGNRIGVSADAKPLGNGRAGYARADDECLAVLDSRGFDMTLSNRAAGQHVLLCSETLRLLDRESGAFQGRAHRRGNTPGRGRGARRRQAPQVPEQPRVPHFRVLRRREAVEVDRVGGERELRQPLGDVAEKEGQSDISALEFEPVHPGHEHRPAGDEFIALQPFVFLQYEREIRTLERMLLHGNEMQPLAALRIVAPGLPGREERQPEAEAGLEHGEQAPAAPAPGKPVAVQEHVPRLRDAAVGAVVHVAVGCAERRAVRGECERGRNHGAGHPLIVMQ